MRRVSLLIVLVILALAGTTIAAGSAAAGKDAGLAVDFTLTLLHNNDAESQTINAGKGLEDFGGAARFTTVVDNLRSAVPSSPNHGVLMISSGDNFLAGPEFNASLSKGVPFYDTIALELIGYDAVAFGNHDFDFGPDVLADFIAGYGTKPPYIAANLDFSGEPRLQSYVDAGEIVPDIVIIESGEKIGIIGIETPNLPFVSSPRNVVVSDDLTNIIQGKVDALEAAGVNKIILAGHLQNIENDKVLSGTLDGVDIVIAGGGAELLANDGDLLIPGDGDEVYGSYPQMALDKSGNEVPVVTTSGNYRYVGRLVVDFNAAGEVVAINEESGPVRVATGDCNNSLPCNDAVEPNPQVQKEVINPVQAALDKLDKTIVGFSQVDLDGLESSVRHRETNVGDLIADAHKWYATSQAPSYDLPYPDAAIQNSGSIRNDTIISAGSITQLDTFDIVPFANFVAIVPDIPRSQFKEILENSVACTLVSDFADNPNCGSGRFAQISGFSFVWTASGDGLMLDDDDKVIRPGSRVQDVVLDDGTVIVSDGKVREGAAITIAITSYSAGGGDQYPFRGAPFTIVGATSQQALADYIKSGLGGLISRAGYPEGGAGRIVQRQISFLPAIRTD